MGSEYGNIGETWHRILGRNNFTTKKAKKGEEDPTGFRPGVNEGEEGELGPRSGVYPNQGEVDMCIGNREKWFSPIDTLT